MLVNEFFCFPGNMAVLAGIVLTGMAMPPQAAGFDCAKAASAVEKLICADGRLDSLDKQLSEAYAQVRRRCPPADVAADQQRWLKTLRNPCPDAACLVAAYQARLAVLQARQCPAAEACADSGAKLAGAWQLVSESGPFEEIVFRPVGVGGKGGFDTWLHQRPEISGGRWRLEGCELRLLYPDDPDGATAARMTVKALGAERLELLDEGEAIPAVYRRLKP